MSFRCAHAIELIPARLGLASADNANLLVNTPMCPPWATRASRWTATCCRSIVITASPLRHGTMQHFQSPPAVPTLSDEQVHVWRACLRSSAESIARYRGILSSDENERADRYQFETDRNHSVIRRGILRSLLGDYLGVAPSLLQFSYGSYGKPALVTSTGASPPLSFNLSHSAETALYAFAAGRAVGIDVERVRPSVDIESIAERFFSPAEAGVFRSLAVSCRLEAFFNWWTRKEAFSKAIDLGLSLELSRFDVSLRPGEPARLLRTEYGEAETRQWSLHSIDLGPELAATLAVRSVQPEISYYRTRSED